MLRSLKNLEFVVSHANRLEIPMGTQGKMIEMTLEFETLQFKNSIHYRKNVIDLGGYPAHRGFSQGGILLERFMEDFYRPSFLLGRENELPGHGCIATDEIEQPRAAIFVRKDLAHEQHRKRHVFEPTCH